MILISIFSQIGIMISAIMATKLYVSGGWLLVGLILATLNLLPIILLPLVRRAQTMTMGRSNQVENSTEKDAVNAGFDKIKTLSRALAFYMPDILVFFNNFTGSLIAYALPARIAISNEISLNVAVPLFQIGNFCSCLTALLYSYLAGKHKTIDTLKGMAAANALFYLGCLISFSSTTESLQLLPYPYQLCIGLVIMGIGKAGHLNLLMVSKFALYNKWRLKIGGLGKRSATINNVMLCLSSGLGSAVSGVFLKAESEIPIVAFLIGAGIILSSGIILARYVE